MRCRNAHFVLYGRVDGATYNEVGRDSGRRRDEERLAETR